jgi:NTE family protein
MWERPHRNVRCPHHGFLCPAVEVDGGWYGDGGIRQSAPLSPALHLGAKRILAISTRYECSRVEADTSMIRGYPPPVQIIGAIMNSIFLDVLDQDARSLELVDRLLKQIPQGKAHEPWPVKLFMLRPSCDIGKLSAQFEPHLPGMFRHLGRGICAHRSKSPDWLSMVMFQPRYLERLMAIGEAGAEALRPRVLCQIRMNAKPIRLKSSAIEFASRRKA